MKFKPIVLSIFVLSLSFVLITCSQGPEWKSVGDGVQEQWTHGVLYYNYELRDGDLDVYIKYTGGKMYLQFWTQAKYFQRRRSVVLLENKKPLDFDPDVDLVPSQGWDYLKSSFYFPDGFSYFENDQKTNYMEKGKSDNYTLILNPSAAATIIQDLFAGEGGTDITFKDGGYEYKFRIYSKGLSESDV